MKNGILTFSMMALVLVLVVVAVVSNTGNRKREGLDRSLFPSSLKQLKGEVTLLEQQKSKDVNSLTKRIENLESQLGLLLPRMGAGLRAAPAVGK